MKKTKGLAGAQPGKKDAESSPAISYTTRDLAKLAGVTERQLQWWDEQGVVRPLKVKGNRVWMAHHVGTVAAVAALRGLGISLQKCRRIIVRHSTDSIMLAVASAQHLKILGVIIR